MCQVTSYKFNLFDLNIAHFAIPAKLSLFRRLTKRLPFCCKYCGKMLRTLKPHERVFDFKKKNGWIIIESGGHNPIHYSNPYGHGCPDGHYGAIPYRLRTMFEVTPYEVSFNSIERTCHNKRMPHS